MASGRAVITTQVTDSILVVLMRSLLVQNAPATPKAAPIVRAADYAQIDLETTP
jgi:hypothetical protein